MRDSMEQVGELFRSKIECIWIDTYEEQAAINDLRELILRDFPTMQLNTWSPATGLRRIALSDVERQEPANSNIASPASLFKLIEGAQNNEMSREESAYVLLDFHHFSSNAVANRGLRDLKEYPPYINYNPVIVLSPRQDLPIEQEKLFTIVTYALPSKAELREELRAMTEIVNVLHSQGKQVIVPDEAEQEKLVNSLIGLTINEVRNALAKSLVRYKELSVRAIMEEKIQLIKKSGVIDYIVPVYSFDDIGGNEAFKNWLLEVGESFSEEAREFGVSPSKGYMAFGIPGSCKSVSAQAIASMMSWPLLSIEMSKLKLVC